MSIFAHDEGDPRRRVVMLCMAIAVTAGSATVPKEQHREPSFANDDPSSARRGRLIAPQLREHPDRVGLDSCRNNGARYVEDLVHWHPHIFRLAELFLRRCPAFTNPVTVWMVGLPSLLIATQPVGIVF